MDRAGIPIQKIRDSITLIQKMPFSSSRKRMSSVVLDDKGVNIYVKGASEIILESCT